MILHEDARYRQSGGLNEIYPDSVDLTFTLNSENVTLTLKRNRRQNGNLPVYLDVGEKVQQWEPASSQVKSAIYSIH